MPLKGLQKPTARPKGGIEAVEIALATGYDPEFSTPVRYAFREDRATYNEVLEGDMVRHTLTMELPAEKGSREAMEELLSRSPDAGFVALITLTSGERLLAGYSARFGAGYPLRVVSTAGASGRTPADCPTFTVTLESIDADHSQIIE